MFICVNLELTHKGVTFFKYSTGNINSFQKKMSSILTVGHKTLTQGKRNSINTYNYKSPSEIIYTGRYNVSHMNKNSSSSAFILSHQRNQIEEYNSNYKMK